MCRRHEPCAIPPISGFAHKGQWGVVLVVVLEEVVLTSSISIKYKLSQGTVGCQQLMGRQGSPTGCQPPRKTPPVLTNDPLLKKTRTNSGKEGSFATRYLDKCATHPTHSPTPHMGQALLLAPTAQTDS